MSRLYVWIDSDTLKTTHTARANKSLNIRVNYGSKDNSKQLIEVQIDYPKNVDKPQIKVRSALPLSEICARDLFATTISALRREQK